MYHPAKNWRHGFAAIMSFHREAALSRKFTGGASLPYGLDPLGYNGDPSGSEPLRGSRLIVTDQMISGANAVLWRDPSMVL